MALTPGPVRYALAAARDVAVIMGAAARRAFAEHWYFAEFAASGEGSHGETCDLARFSTLRQLLLTEFARLWNRR